MNIINQNRAVQEQYKTANNLDKRISIHTKYSTNKMGFGNWIFLTIILYLILKY